MISQWLAYVPLFDPGSRLHYASVICSAVIALLFLYVRGYQFKRSQVKAWANYWTHPSAIVDYKVFFTNALIKVIFFAPLLALNFYFAKLTLRFLHSTFSDFGSLQGSALAFLVATLFAFLVDDFLRFFHHYLMHKVPFLWELHKTHHSAEVLTPITLYRIHPLESAMATIRNGIGIGFTTGVFLFVFSAKATLFTVLGVNLFAFLFNLTFGNLRHSHLDISFGFLERLFISPKQHQIHHSNQRKHFDKNFGVVLSIWDQLFGTYLSSKSQSVQKFGVDGVNANKFIDQYFRWNPRDQKTTGSNRKTQTLGVIESH